MPKSKKKDKKKNRATAPDQESVAGAELNGSLATTARRKPPNQ